MKITCYNCDGTGYILVGSTNSMNEDYYEECCICEGEYLIEADDED